MLSKKLIAISFPGSYLLWKIYCKLYGDFAESWEAYRKRPEFWDREHARNYARLRETVKPETPVEAAVPENSVSLSAICDGKEGEIQNEI